MKKKYLEAGKITTAHGINGEVRVQSLCDSLELLCEFDNFFLDDKGEKEIQVINSRIHKNIVIMELEEVLDRNQAESLKNTILYIDRDCLELPKDTYFIQDLIGLKVVDYNDNSISYGEIMDITKTGSNDVYHSKLNDKLYLIPAIPSVIKKTNLENNTMEITPLEGLFDD